MPQRQPAGIAVITGRQVRQVRRNAAGRGKPDQRKPVLQIPGSRRAARRCCACGTALPDQIPGMAALARLSRAGTFSKRGDLQQQAWRWALAHRASDGSLPSGLEIARQHGRHERWGRLVKRAGAAGEFATEPSLRLIDQRLSSAQSE
jgi:hypothetical protein